LLLPQRIPLDANPNTTSKCDVLIDRLGDLDERQPYSVCQVFPLWKCVDGANEFGGKAPEGEVERIAITTIRHDEYG
jgi:hypothetical protein